MMTLKQLVQWQEFSGLTDAQLIAYWIENNDNNDEVLDFCINALKNKISKTQYLYSYLQSNIEMGALVGSNADKYTPDQLCLLERAYNQFVSFGRISTYLYKQLEDAMPHMKCPTFFYRDVITYLNSIGLYFEDDDPAKIDTTYYVNSQWKALIDKENARQDMCRKQEAEQMGYVFENSFVTDEWLKQYKGQK